MCHGAVLPGTGGEKLSCCGVTKWTVESWRHASSWKVSLKALWTWQHEKKSQHLRFVDPHFSGQSPSFVVWHAPMWMVSWSLLNTGMAGRWHCSCSDPGPGLNPSVLPNHVGMTSQFCCFRYWLHLITFFLWLSEHMFGSATGNDDSGSSNEMYRRSVYLPLFACVYIHAYYILLHVILYTAYISNIWWVVTSMWAFRHGLEPAPLAGEPQRWHWQEKPFVESWFLHIYKIIDHYWSVKSRWYYSGLTQLFMTFENIEFRFDSVSYGFLSYQFTSCSDRNCGIVHRTWRFLFAARCADSSLGGNPVWI